MTKSTLAVPDMFRLLDTSCVVQDILRFIAAREETLFSLDEYVSYSLEYQKRIT